MPMGLLRKSSLAISAILLASAAAQADERYSIEGMVLNQFLNFSSDAYRQYKCDASTQFRDHFWCARRQNAQNVNGNFVKNYSVAHNREGRVSYINLAFDPAFFNSGEVRREILRLNQKFRQNAAVLNFQRQGRLPAAVIASWGDVRFEEIDQNSRMMLAGGLSPNVGILIDYIGQLRQSARLSLPIFRITGGAGYIWSASYDANGVGHLRLTAINADQLYSTPQIVAQDRENETARSQSTMSQSERLEMLERLGRLKASGVLTEEEFNREKESVLAP